MKRFRLSTLLLLVVIVGLVFALVVEKRRAARCESELRATIQRGEVEMARLTAEQRRVMRILQVSPGWKGEKIDGK